MTRVAVQDLIPNTNYAVQVRAVRGGQTSGWSERFLFTTSQNSAIPAAPATVTWISVGDGFFATWTEVTQDVGGKAAVIVSYELELTAGATVKVVVVPAQVGQSGQWALDFQGNIALFNTAQPSISLRVRAVNNKGIKGNWSGSINAQNPVPANVTGFTGTSQQNGVDLSWTPNTDTDLDHYEVFVGTTSGFTPTIGNRIFTGIATHFFYVSTTYSAQYFKIRAYDKFGQASASDTLAGPYTPISPFIVDVTAPNTPTSLAGSITNNANGIGATATMTWVMTSPPSDLAGYNLRYRPVGGTAYEYMNGIDQGVLTATVTYLQAYTNYEFQIQAYDFSYNKSAWSSTYTATSPSNAAPANVGGLSSVSDSNSITYTWTGVADTDIKNYEVTFSTSPTFASGNITYFTGTSTTLNVGGLTPATTYYARVRAVDTGGLTSAAFSATDTRATAGSAAASDGVVPGTANTPSVLGGLSYLYTTWAPVTTNASAGAQNDTVTYEVHLSTTTGFTPSGATKVDEVSGTSMVIDHLPGTTTALSYGTTYFVKIIAKDRDGSGTASAQGSGQISKIASGDVTSIGADLIVPGSGFVQNLVIGTGGSIQSSDYSAGTAGYKLNTTGGLELNSGSVKANLLTAGTIGSSTGTIQIAAGAIINLNGGYLKSNTYTGTSAASNPSGAGFYLGNDGLRIDQGTISAAAFAGGTFSTGTITLSGGAITGGGWTLNSSGLTIPAGAINASALNIQTGENLVPVEYADFEANPSWYTTGITLNRSTMAISTTDFKFNKQALAWTQSNTTNRLVLGSSVTDYNIPVTPNKTYIISMYAMIKTGSTSGTPNVRLQYNGNPSLLSNSDFESGSTGWTATGGGITLTSSDQVGPVSGYLDLRTQGTTTGADTYISQTVSCSPSTQYTFSVWRRVQSITGAATGNRSIMLIDSSGTNAFTTTLTTGVTIGQWIQDTVTLTTSGTATTLTARIYVANGDMYVDNAQLEKGATTTPPGLVANNFGSSVPANSTWNRYSVVLTIPNNAPITGAQIQMSTTFTTTIYIDGIQVEEQFAGSTTPSTFGKPGITSISGDIIRTGSIISSATTVVNGSTIPVWSIPLNGSASFANLQVRGNAVIGVAGGTDGGQSNLSSGNYIAGTTGWQIKSDGSAEFNGATLKGGAITGTSFATDVTGQPRVEVADTNTLSGSGYPFIKFYGDGTEYAPGSIASWASSTSGLFQIVAPAARSIDNPAVFVMETGPGGVPSTDTSDIVLSADQITLDGTLFFSLDPGWIGTVASNTLISNNAITALSPTISSPYWSQTGGLYTYNGPTGAMFFVHAAVSWDNSVTSGRREMYIEKNGAAAYMKSQQASSWSTINVGQEISGCVVLNPGDTLGVRVYQNTGGSITIYGTSFSAGTRITVMRIG